MATANSKTAIDDLREEILERDNRTCFIEREHLLDEFDRISDRYTGEKRYAAALKYLLEGLSTPIDDRERIVGSMVEALPAPEEKLPEEIHWHDYINWNILAGPGHLTPDYERVLSIGLCGIAEAAAETAERVNTPRARLFAENARDCVEAVRKFARRYAVAARDAGNAEAANALERVPDQPARNFFEAVQSCWFVHFILSCCIGGRDYGFGRMDQYLLPFYETDTSDGRLTRAEAVDIVADFCLKTNAIAGTGCAHYHTKPVPCQSSKQYVVLGGTSQDGHDQSNAVSFVFLDAARKVRLVQPTLNVRFDPRVDTPLKLAAAKAAIELQGQVQFSNDRLIPRSLVQKGIRPEDAYDYTATGCSRIDVGPTHSCNEHYLSPVFWLLESLGWDGEAKQFCAPNYSGFEDLFSGFREAATAALRREADRYLAQAEPVYECAFNNGGGEHFHFESLLLRDCVDRGLNTCQGGTRYIFHTVWFAGIATIADTLMAIKKLVFEQERYTLQEALDITARNFEGHEVLQGEIRNSIAKFGNDHFEVDALARRVAKMLLDGVDAIETPEGTILYGAFYSLMNHQSIGARLPATFDGRPAGEPISENQSPSYGADSKGTTAVLNSVAKLPFERACSGTLNMRFTSGISPEKLRALADGYFSMGGSILGMSFVDRATLEDALEHPERHQTLYVRMYGFSEYFNALPRNEKLELIHRTEHSI